MHATGAGARVRRKGKSSKKPITAPGALHPLGPGHSLEMHPVGNDTHTAPMQMMTQKRGIGNLNGKVKPDRERDTARLEATTNRSKSSKSSAISLYPDSSVTVEYAKSKPQSQAAPAVNPVSGNSNGKRALEFNLATPAGAAGVGNINNEVGAATVGSKTEQTNALALRHRSQSRTRMSNKQPDPARIVMYSIGIPSSQADLQWPLASPE